jgi:hypothetical protein
MAHDPLASHIKQNYQWLLLSHDSSKYVWHSSKPIFKYGSGIENVMDPIKYTQYLESYGWWVLLNQRAGHGPASLHWLSAFLAHEVTHDQ